MSMNLLLNLDVHVGCVTLNAKVLWSFQVIQSSPLTTEGKVILTNILQIASEVLPYSYTFQLITGYVLVNKSLNAVA